jgi:HSP20 family protein
VVTKEGRSITPFRPFRQLSELQEELDSMWESIGLPRFWGLAGRAVTEHWMPAIDVFERDGKVVVKAELPGLTEKDIEIKANAQTLTISGEKKEEKEVKEENYYRCERSYGRFSRQVSLPPGADASRAQASFKNGVLEVEIPVEEGAREKKIEVKAAG